MKYINKQLSNKWTIDARAFHIKYTPFTHNFWALTDANNNIIDQIHGLAVDPVTGVAKAIGTCHHLLQAIRDSNITWSLQPGQPTIICATGHELETKERWQSAVNALPALNALKLHYPNLWQHFYRKNSNTIFNSIGKIMGFSEPALLLSTCAPGINLVISQEIINHYLYKQRP